MVDDAGVEVLPGQRMKKRAGFLEGLAAVAIAGQGVDQLGGNRPVVLDDRDPHTSPPTFALKVPIY